jgi:uncharacterized protein (DUF1697 family)
MARYIVLLRAVNVGGTGKVAMSDLSRLCEEEGCRDVRTYLASGNVVLSSPLDAAQLKVALETRLERLMGKASPMLIRTPEDMAVALHANPFGDVDPSRCMICFLEHPPPADTLDHLRHRTDERLALGLAEIYVAYPGGMGKSRLVIPAAKSGTMRNINSVRELLRLAALA